MGRDGRNDRGQQDLGRRGNLAEVHIDPPFGPIDFLALRWYSPAAAPVASHIRQRGQRHGWSAVGRSFQGWPDRPLRCGAGGRQAGPGALRHLADRQGHRSLRAGILCRRRPDVGSELQDSVYPHPRQINPHHSHTNTRGASMGHSFICAARVDLVTQGSHVRVCRGGRSMTSLATPYGAEYRLKHAHPGARGASLRNVYVIDLYGGC